MATVQAAIGSSSRHDLIEHPQDISLLAESALAASQSANISTSIVLFYLAFDAIAIVYFTGVMEFVVAVSPGLI